MKNFKTFFIFQIVFSTMTLAQGSGNLSVSDLEQAEASQAEQNDKIKVAVATASAAGTLYSANRAGKESVVKSRAAEVLKQAQRVESFETAMALRDKLDQHSQAQFKKLHANAGVETIAEMEAKLSEIGKRLDVA